MSKTKIIHFTTVHPMFDTRIFYKECVSLAAAGFDVTLMAPGGISGEQSGVHLVSLESYASRRDRFRRGTRAVYDRLLETDADFYHFHDPELFFVARRLQRRGRRVIYDAHESVAKDIAGKPYLKKWQAALFGPIVGFIERNVAKRLTHVVCATPAIASQFAFPSTVVANYPLLAEWLSVDTTWASYEVRPMMGVYVGGINEERCADVMIGAAGLACPGKVVPCLGLAGSLEPADMNVDMPGVKYFGVLPRVEVSKLMEQARFGLAIFQSRPNITSALPTKILEYMACGIPVIVSNSLHVGVSIVDDTGCGLAVDETDERAVANAIEWILSHPREAFEMGSRGRDAVLEQYSWESEEERLVELYMRLDAEGAK